MGETLRLKSGREVEIIDGRIPHKVAEDLFREASEQLKMGRLEFAGEYWELIADKMRGLPLAARAAEARAKIPKIEYSSLILLKNGKTVKGKVKAHLRADLLGLEGKEEIFLWQLEEIVAEYHPGYSWVSKSYYPLTLLEIKFRGGERKTSRTMAEIEFEVEGADGSVAKMVLGNRFEILRPHDLGGQLDEKTHDRIIKVVIYPEIKRLE